MAVVIGEQYLKTLTQKKVEELANGGKVKGQISAHMNPDVEHLSGISCLSMEGAPNTCFRYDDLLSQLGRLGMNNNLYVLVSVQDGEVCLEYRKPHADEDCGKIVARQKID